MHRDQVVDRGRLLVNENGKKVVVYGKSANAPLRTAAGVYCNVRPYGTITCVRFHAGSALLAGRQKFQVDRATGTIHSEMNTPGVRMAYAVRLVPEDGPRDRAGGTRRHQADPGAGGCHQCRHPALAACREPGLSSSAAMPWMPIAEHKANVDAIVALLPGDFKAGMENWGGEINEHISDTNFGILMHDMYQQRKVIIYATDLDGDRLTDLMATPLTCCAAGARGCWTTSRPAPTCRRSGATWLHDDQRPRT